MSAGKEQAGMDVRAQVSMVFHLDKCIGCHTCSIACKNIWTDRRGAEYMWWNNVETKPGTGFPTLWEDQERYRGGWEVDGDRLRLRLQGKASTLGNIFANPALPTVDDYYEPWTYDYEHLFDAPAGDDQPTARTVSMITGEPMDVEAGPNWDDDLGGSPIYAANDPNLEHVSEAERAQLNELEQMMFFYLPRICNHCVNPSCVAACPAGALYKRGEDGIVLLNQERCRAWRMCISGCPYKKTYYNWATGKSEKCILCYPRLESGQAPACFHSCVGRIRYLGVLLYDASRLERAATAPDAELVEAQRAMILDPFDEDVLAAARASGLSEPMLTAAQHSPVYRFVKRWRLALPLHPEFRTLPMLFYVPPMLPVIARLEGGRYEVDGASGNGTGAMPSLSNLEQTRAPLRYLASLFAAGNEEVVAAVYRKLFAVRVVMRAKSVGNVPEEEVEAALAAAKLGREDAEAIFELTSKPTFQERFVLPPLARELQVEAVESPERRKQEAGFGFRQPGERRF
ncbi:MAG TPA: nitrate reductase subunit beta [Gaiellaceae bacterium]|nr:nitrate reductase subunit beta [Gaiellaceae bacterium]